MYIGNDLRYGRSEVYYFTATSGGETSIATASDGRAIRYTVGFCTVYLNGIRLHDTDITVTSGTSVAFTSALSLNDVVTVEATHPLSIANAVPIGGGAFTGAVTLPSPILTGTTTAPSLSLTPGSAPGSPTEGQIYYDSTSDTVKVRNATAWVTVNNMFHGIGGIETEYALSGIYYKVHTFTTSGNFSVTGSGSVDYLVVGGGGGGGGGNGSSGWVGGGGGAGGFLTAASYALTTQTYTITVGAGGIGGVYQGQATIGGNSSIVPVSSGSSIISTGGGYGGSQEFNSGAAGNGGSGGGAAEGATAGTASPAGQGYAGNAGAVHYGGGGGGASEAGNTDGTRYGGDGLSNIYKTGSAVTYAGGGGGGVDQDVTQNTAPGGDGGGGTGGSKTGGAATAGSANTGGGGGGGGGNSVGFLGGSGIVIIRYAI